MRSIAERDRPRERKRGLERERERRAATAQRGVQNIHIDIEQSTGDRQIRTILVERAMIERERREI